jgi:uncharacterized damage-inducible protein DinB
LEKAALLSEAEVRAHPGYGHGSIFDLFFHLLAATYGWRTGLASGQQPPRLSAAEYTTLASLRDGLAVESAALGALVAAWSDEQIAGTITLTTLRGNQMSFDLWRILQHLNFHFMQHHTEIAQLLTAQGQSPGDIDFLFYRG